MLASPSQPQFSSTQNPVSLSQTVAAMELSSLNQQTLKRIIFGKYIEMPRRERAKAKRTIKRQKQNQTNNLSYSTHNRLETKRDASYSYKAKVF